MALAEDGVLIEFSVERATVRGLVGNIYKGKVENVLSGMKAAFVNIGLGRNGFLYVGESLVDSDRLKCSRQPSPLNVSAGDIIMCQVVKDEFGQKGARLTTDVTLPGFYLVLLPRSVFLGVSRRIEDDGRRLYLEELVKSVCPPNMGFIIRSAAEKASDDDIKAEAQSLVELWERVQMDYYRAEPKTMVFQEAFLLERAIRDTFNEEVDAIVVNEPIVAKQLEGKVGRAEIELYEGDHNIMTHFKIAEQINALSERRVELENGAYIVIDKTEALTVIDVNTGKFVGGRDLEDTVYKTNVAAAECIARQLRLRNISGIVIIDFIDMQLEEHRTQVLEKLRAELKKDRLKTSVASMTGLGLCELTRKKTRLPVDAFMLQDCKECMGGVVVSDAQLVFMLRNELVEYSLKAPCSVLSAGVHPDVFDAAFETRIMERELNQVWKDKAVYLIKDSTVKRSEFLISSNADDGFGLPSGAVRLQ